VQWNIVIRAEKKQVVTQWGAQQNIAIDTKYEASKNPYAPVIKLLDRQFESYIYGIDPMAQWTGGHHCTREDVTSFLELHNQVPDAITTNKLNLLWAERITPSGTLYTRWVIDDILIPLAGFLRETWTAEKQTHTDLLATQIAGKNKIIDATDYVALGWTVNQEGSSISPDIAI
jgi:hypothetical protein